MTISTRANALRSAIYGTLVVASVGLGCGRSPRGCSCAKLPTNLLLPGPPEKKTFSDVDMVSDGAEPRITLRVARWAGLRYRSMIEASGSMSFEGQPPFQGPSVQTTLRHEVVRGSTDPIVQSVDGGAVSLVEERVTIEKMVPRQTNGDASTLDAWRQMLRPMLGTTLRERISESGAVVSLEREGGGALSAKAAQDLVKASLDNQRHFPFRLPPMPIGIGARWRFHDTLDFAGIHTTQIAEMTLKAVNDQTAIVGVILRQEAPSQNVPHPFLPGKTARVDQFRGDGEGEVEVDRLTAIVRRGRLVGAARLMLTGEVNGQVGTASLSAMSVIAVSANVISEDPTIPVDGSDAPAPSQ